MLPSFKIIGLLVLEMKILKVFFFIYGRGGHLGHVPLTININCLSPCPSWHHVKFGLDWPSDLREE